MINWLNNNIAQTSIFSSERKLKKWTKHSKTPQFLYDTGLFETKEKQRFVITFYGGYAKSSYKNMGESYGTSKYVAQDHIKQWINLGYINKVNNLYKPDLYIKSKGRNCLVQGENYYSLTSKGKAYRKKILHNAIQKCREISKQDEIERLNEINKVKQVFENALKNLFTPILNYPHTSEEESQERGLRPPGSFAFEGKNLRVLERCQTSCDSLDWISKVCKAKTKPKPLNKQKFSETSHIAEESFKNTEKFRAIQKIFCRFGFNKMLDKAYIGTLLKLMTLSMEFIEKLLKLLRSKLKHKWKLRSFWGFFMSEVRKLPDRRRFSDPWFKMLSKEYRDASEGKKSRVNDGVDSSVIVQGISKMERETGEKVSEKTLERMLYHGTQKLKTAIDTIAYRMDLGKGDFPKEKSLREVEEAEKPKQRPIFKQVKINTETKQLYTDEDFIEDKPFAFTNKIIGYEPTSQQKQEDHIKRCKTSETKPQNQPTKIHSWIGMVFFALKIGNPCAIQKAFFEKREEAR